MNDRDGTTDVARVQIITTPGGERIAVLPAEDYEALVDAAGDEADPAEEEALAAEMRRLRAEDPRAGLPSEHFRRILAGESAIRVWREYRGLAPDVLAERVGVPVHVLADAEARPADSSIETLRAIARELEVPLDELV
jgi:ribosome-binding protein aMBF1 (putative translation factor)